jgi:dihydroorotate dehydrogenase electron transfer subunit
LRKFSGYYPLVRREKLTPSVFKFTFSAPEIASLARPGQFVQIRTSKDYFPLWPRPFSINSSDETRGEISVIFKIFGCGTSQLAGMDEGCRVHILGPLGNSFPSLNDKSRVIMAGGGVGMPPLYFLASNSVNNGYPAERIVFISGARTKDDLFDDGGLARLGTTLRICTDDGSAGEKGTVVDLLQKEMQTGGEAVIFACGPTAMLAKVDRMLVERRMRGFLSLEALMPCGYGICSGCAVRVKPPADRGPTDDNRDFHLKRVCVDGPVFEPGEVIWP